ncbi:MAG: hypothetical protein AAGK17_07740, partial [Pseudomonadota bacterium]
GAKEQAGDGFVERWLEEIESDLAPDMTTENGQGILYRHDNARYISAWPDRGLLDQLLTLMANEGGVQLTPLPEGLRIGRTQSHVFAFNYSAKPVDISTVTNAAHLIIGANPLPPAGVAVWER